MRESLEASLDLFADNVQAVRQGLRFEDGSAGLMDALLCTREGKPVDCQAVKESTI
jgi:hypothetical protein